MKDRCNALKSKHKSRQSKEFTEKELQSKRTARESSETKIKDKCNALKSKHKERQSKEFTDKELQAKRYRRANPLVLEQERMLKKEIRNRNSDIEKERNAFAKASKRKLFDYCEHETSLAKRRCFGSNLDQCISNFHKKSAQGPIYVCTCCHQTWFPKSVVKRCKVNISKESEAYCTGLKSVDNEDWLCSTCQASLREQQIPQLSVKNGMYWPEKPEVLNLHPLEE